MDIKTSYYETLYQRSVVQLSGYSAKYALPQSLYAYLAFGGPTASMKDALAEGMLAIATEKGLLQPGQPVIETSSGSFAVALAIACAHSRHPLILCMPSSVPEARQKLFIKLGAKIALTNQIYGRMGMKKRAREAVEKTGGYYLDYFDNDLNAEFHRRVTGPNIARATEGALDAIVVGVGSGGTITGVGEFMKAWYPDVRMIAVEPYESQVLAGREAGAHSIPGLGAGFVPENYNPYIVDAIIPVTSQDAAESAQEVLKTDAIPASPSCGAVLHAAHRYMKENKEMRRVLCIFSGKETFE